MGELKQTSTGRPRFLQPGLAVNLTSKHPLLSKLPEEPEELIRWMATEPSPIAKLMDGMTFTYHSGSRMKVSHSSRIFRKAGETPDSDFNLQTMLEMRIWTVPRLIFDWEKRDVIRRWQGIRLPPPFPYRDSQNTTWWQNQKEQDRIAKTLEPVVAESNLKKLHPVLRKKIRWWATEPSPTAKLINGLNIYTTDVMIGVMSHRATVVEADSAEFLHTWPINRAQNHLSYTRRYFHNAFLCLGSRQKRNKKVLINALPDGWEVSADLGRHPVAKLIEDWYWWDKPIPIQLLNSL